MLYSVMCHILSCCISGNLLSVDILYVRFIFLIVPESHMKFVYSACNYGTLYRDHGDVEVLSLIHI